MTYLDPYYNKRGSVGRNHRPVDCYAPDYHVASWKGVEFFCDTSADEFGRRGDLYEYPLSDDIGYVDLGRKARRFKVEGYLIGRDQDDQSVRMALRAENPQPGILIHPLYGRQSVACVSLTTTADYRREKKRTKLSFEFIEAYSSQSYAQAGGTVGQIFSSSNNAIDASRGSANWDPGARDIELLGDVSTALGQQFNPDPNVMVNEQNFDAVDTLNRWLPFRPGAPLPTRPFTALTARDVTPSVMPTYGIPSFTAAVAPIDFASAVLRQIHLDALERLREFNAYVVDRTEAMALTPSARSLIITTRLIAIRDYAIAAAQKRYDTVKDALDDLDFIMQVFDDEERLATEQCDDVLVAAIRQARATAASVILAANITRPGIVEFHVDGEWPSLVVAHKIYGNGRRYEQVERYNPTMLNFWMGRSVIAPAR